MAKLSSYTRLHSLPGWDNSCYNLISPRVTVWVATKLAVFVHSGASRKTLRGCATVLSPLLCSCLIWTKANCGLRRQNSSPTNHHYFGEPDHRDHHLRDRCRRVINSSSSSSRTVDVGPSVDRSVVGPFKSAGNKSFVNSEFPLQWFRPLNTARLVLAPGIKIAPQELDSSRRRISRKRWLMHSHSWRYARSVRWQRVRPFCRGCAESNLTSDARSLWIVFVRTSQPPNSEMNSREKFRNTGERTM